MSSVADLPEAASIETFERAIEEAEDRAGEPEAEGPGAGVASELGEAEREYRSLMRKWWFAAAVGVPAMILSYPWVFPVLGDWLPRESDRLRAVWAVMGLFALAVLAYSGAQFFTGAWRALRHRQANMHTLIAIGTGVAWVYSTIALSFPGF